jgi:hypothetical protein
LGAIELAASLRCATAACFKSISCNKIELAASLPLLASNRVVAINELGAIELAALLRYRWLLQID